MVGLLDIAPSAAKAVIRGQDIPTPGISAKGILHLLTRFPALVRLMRPGVKSEEIVGAIMTVGGDLVPAVIAAGLGLPGDEDQEQAAAGLALEEQFDLIAAIVKATIPNGPRPFVDKLEAMGLIKRGDPSATDPATKSPTPSSSSPGKASGKRTAGT